MTYNQFRSFNLDAVNELCNQACIDPVLLLDNLGLSHLKRVGKRFAGYCPVHNGDNNSAFNFYPDGDSVPGYWVCRTHHCEEKYGKNLIGLIKGIYRCNFAKAVEILLEYSKYKSLDEVKLPPSEVLAKRKANRIFQKINYIPYISNNTNKWTRDFVRKTLEIPSNYYISRGYDSKILDKYDVGFYSKIDRVSVPVYDNDHNYCVGFSARSIYDKCSKCKYYHNPEKLCPSTDEEKINSFKWRNSKNFECSNYLYNYWFAKDEILKTGVAVIVEGPGDVWKLEQNGIKNSLAIFGSSLRDNQRIVLDGSGALTLIVLLDNDEAGIKGALNLKKDLGRTYRLFFPKISTKDVGDLHNDSITKEIEPLIRRLSDG